MYMQNYYSKFKLPCPQNPKSPCQKLRKSPPSMIPTTPRYPGGDILAGAEPGEEGISFLSLAKEIARHHHERWDGKGYPQGLKGDEIPLSASIISLVDAYEAMTSPRAYRKAYSHKEVCEIILQEKGKQFAPDIVDAFLIHEKIFEAINLSEV